MKLAAYLLLGIAVGAGVAYWQTSGDAGRDRDPRLDGEAEAPLQRRLSALETELELERYERQALAEELAALRASLGNSPEGTPTAADDRRARVQALTESEPGVVREPRSGGAGAGERTFDEDFLRQRQIDNFVAAGLSPERAQWILQREDELEMESLRARYEATQNGASPEEVANLTGSQMMRAELGDADYEKYLEGRGRPTSINVRDVLTNSPAAAAGLVPGDEIIAYDGRRVFDMNELTELTHQGRPGEAVPIDIVRDGQRMQIYVERGPIGISGGGRSTRRGR